MDLYFEKQLVVTVGCSSAVAKPGSGGTEGGHMDNCAVEVPTAETDSGMDLDGPSEEGIQGNTVMNGDKDWEAWPKW